MTNARLPVPNEKAPSKIEQAMKELGDACIAEDNDADYSATIEYPDDIKMFIVAIRYNNKYTLKSELGRIAEGFVAKTNQEQEETNDQEP